MAEKTICKYKDQIIGIENIYTIQGGLRINISGKVEELRKLGRKINFSVPAAVVAI